MVATQLELNLISNQSNSNSQMPTGR